MRFAHPWALLLLVIPIALAWRIWKRGGGRVVLPFDHHPHAGGRWLRAAIDSADRADCARTLDFGGSPVRRADLHDPAGRLVALYGQLARECAG